MLLAVAACSSAAAALACTYSPVSFRVASDVVPVEGPVLIEIICQGTDFCETESIDALTVTGPSGEVPGSLEAVRGSASVAFLVWRPSVPLEVGQHYAVRIRDEALAAEGEPAPLDVQVDAGFRWQDAGEPSWQLTTVIEDVGERFCCFAALACFDHCFTEARAEKVTLAPALPTAARFAGSVYALRWSEADGSVKRQVFQPWLRYSDDTPTHSSLRAVFEQPAERYCATLEVRDLVSGAMRELTHCEAPRPAAQVGKRLEPVVDQEALRDCQVPPGMDSACDPSAETCEQRSPVLQRAWCEVNQASCANGQSGRWMGLCEKHAAVCADVPNIPSESSARGCQLHSRPLDGSFGYAQLGFVLLLARRRRLRAARAAS